MRPREVWVAIDRVRVGSNLCQINVVGGPGPADAEVTAEESVASVDTGA